MKKILIGTVAALSMLAGAASPAAARPYWGGGWGHYHHGYYGGGDAFGNFLLGGLLVGGAVAIASSASRDSRPVYRSSSVDDVRDAGVLRVERFGTSGTPIILVPGLASGSWVWKDTIDALEKSHRVYAVTLAGFDGRPAAAGDPMRAALEALRALVVEEKLGKPVVIGHSLGGMLGLQLAAAYPDLVGGVVTVDGLPVSDH